MTQDVLIEQDGGVGWIRLNRPERRNALTYPMLDALLGACEQLAADDHVRAVVLTGAGPAFCAGGDIAGLVAAADAERSVPCEVRIARQRHWHRISLLLHRMHKPTVAAVNGPAVGAGFSLALACDLRILSTTAVFRTGFAKLGVPGDFGGIWFAQRLLGEARAKDLFLRDPPVSAERALDIGLASLVTDPDGFAATVNEVAAGLAAGGGYGAMKDHFADAGGSDLAAHLDREAVDMVQALASPEFLQAAHRFLAQGPRSFHTGAGASRIVAG